MSSGSHHGHHEHGNDHGHGPVIHGVPPEAREAYTRAYAAAVPYADRSVVEVDLDAREVDWEFAPGMVTRAWGFNGQIPGPVIQARVGDVLEIRFTNHLPEPTVIHESGMMGHFAVVR